MIILRRSDKIDLLRKVPLFADLSKRQLNEIAKHSVDMEMSEGEILVSEGKHGGVLMVIIDGHAKVQKGDKTINRLSEGDFFGEISLIDGKPRMASVIAETYGTIMVIHSKVFKKLVDRVPGLSKKILVALCEYLRHSEGIADRSDQKVP